MIFNTRIAPSPTGYFHLGTARTAYFCWLLARSSGGKFILRIDDTDVNRNNEEYVDVVYHCMEWLKLDFDYTFRQSDRLDVYRNYIEQLIHNNLAYEHDGAFRLYEQELPDLFIDYVGGKTNISKQDKNIAKDMIIFKSNGMPTYHFASVADDIDYDITLVLRGKDHISNTARHIAISQAFEKIGKTNNIQYGHVGLITDGNKKLSKSNDAANLLNYSNNYSPDTILNYLLKLGWSHTDPEIDKKFPLIDKKLALDIFMDGNLRQSNSKMDNNKLLWLNKKYKNRIT